MMWRSIRGANRYRVRSPPDDQRVFASHRPCTTGTSCYSPAVTRVADLEQRAKGQWERAAALSRMFARSSKAAGKRSHRLSVSSIGLGVATGVMGVTTTALGTKAAVVTGVVTGLLGVGTGAVNTIRETIFPSKREGELWGMRNAVAKVQDNFEDLILGLRLPAADVDGIEAAISAKRDELRGIEENALANQVEPDDEQQARRDYEDNPIFSGANGAPEDGAELYASEPEDGAPSAPGMTRPARGGVQ